MCCREPPLNFRARQRPNVSGIFDKGWAHLCISRWDNLNLKTINFWAIQHLKTKLWRTVHLCAKIKLKGRRLRGHQQFKLPCCARHHSPALTVDYHKHLLGQNAALGRDL